MSSSSPEDIPSPKLLSSSPSSHYYGSSPEGLRRSYVADGSEKIVNEISSKLKFIAKIKENEVLDTRSVSLMEVGWKTSLYRTFIARCESKETTYDFFSSAINSSFELIEKYISYEDRFFKDIAMMLIKDLRSAKQGMINHMKTYARYEHHVSKVETLIINIDIRLDSIIRRIQ